MEEAVVIEETKEMQLSKTIDTLIAEMSAITIETQEQYDQISGWLKRNKDTQKVVDEFFEKDRVEAKAAYDKILEKRGAFKKPLEKAEVVARSKLTDFATKMETKRREEQRIEEEKRRKQIEDERLAKAEELSAMGRTEKADDLLEKKVVVSKSSIITETQKVGKTIEVWTVEVKDLSAFLAEAAGLPLIAECIEVSTTKLAALFKKNDITELAGLEIKKTFRPVL